MRTFVPNARPGGHPVDPTAGLYAQRLLEDVGEPAARAAGATPPTDADRWRESGLMALTGYPDAPVAACPVPIASLADGVLEALRSAGGAGILRDLRGADLLTLRAAMTGLGRRGNIAPGGSCRILPCADGHVAVNLARDSDWQALEAWLQVPTPPDWPAVAAVVSRLSKGTLVERGRLLGLAVVDAQPDPPEATAWFERCHAVAAAPAPRQPARVIDLSSLWAGPLCSLLLREAGCEVLKVESSRRPDGARRGDPAFFHFLNAGKQELSLDLHTATGRDALLALLRDADIVIEGSRPRALRQMGIHAEQLLEEVPGLTWLSITGYGRGEPQANWVAYGDDAGVAAGLSDLLHRATGRWMFCGDAIADPLTGMHAALAALATWRSGGGALLSLSLVGTVRHCIRFARETAAQ